MATIVLAQTDTFVLSCVFIAFDIGILRGAVAFDVDWARGTLHGTASVVVVALSVLRYGALERLSSRERSSNHKKKYRCELHNV